MLTLAVLLAAAPPLAAAQTVPAGDTISVIGRTPEEVRKEAKAFVRKLGVAERPVARWVDPVCPKVIGVPARIAGAIEARIREIAIAAGARIGKKGCQANLTVAFAADTDSVLREVTARTPGMFEEYGAASLRSLKASEAPVRWWHTAAERTKDGMRSTGNDAPPAVFGRGAQPGGAPLGGQVYQQYKPSFMSTQMVRALTSASIVVDVNGAAGVPVESVAALAGLVGLAEIRFDEEAPGHSVLALFSPGGPRDLTPLDETFLRTLYKLPLDRSAIAHRGLLVRGLVNGETRRSQR